MDDAVDVIALEEELGLPLVAREAVEDESVVPVVLLQAIVDDGLDEVVIDELTAGHGAPHMGADLRVVLHVPAEDVTDADLGQVEVARQQGSLRSLATALDAHDHVLVHGLTV